MKLSKYTFLLDVEGRRFYTYNTLSNALLEIDEESYDLLHKIETTAEVSVAGFDEELWQALSANNILTESDEDDFLKYKAYIARLCSQRTGMHLTLENAHEYVQLCQFYFERFKERKNIGITPAFVLDRGTSNCDTCKVQSTLFNHKERSEFILDLAKKGFDSPFIRYPERFFNECAIRNDMAIAFDPEGYAYKCWEVIGNKEYAIGKLTEEGTLTDINEKVLNRQLFGADPIDDSTCSQCKYLPICNGGCPIQRIENKFENGKNNNCTYHRGYMEDFLKFHIARKKAMEAAENKQ